MPEGRTSHEVLPSFLYPYPTKKIEKVVRNVQPMLPPFFWLLFADVITQRHCAVPLVKLIKAKKLWKQIKQSSRDSTRSNAS